MRKGKRFNWKTKFLCKNEGFFYLVFTGEKGVKSRAVPAGFYLLFLPAFQDQQFAGSGPVKTRNSSVRYFSYSKIYLPLHVLWNTPVFPFKPYNKIIEAVLT